MNRKSKNHLFCSKVHIILYKIRSVDTVKWNRLSPKIGMQSLFFIRNKNILILLNNISPMEQWRITFIFQREKKWSLILALRFHVWCICHDSCFLTDDLNLFFWYQHLVSRLKGRFIQIFKYYKIICNKYIIYLFLYFKRYKCFNISKFKWTP